MRGLISWPWNHDLSRTQMLTDWATQASLDLLYLFFKRFYLFIHEWHTQTETQAEGEAGSWWGAHVGLDPRSGDPTPNQRQTLNHWATQASLDLLFFFFFLKILFKTCVFLIRVLFFHPNLKLFSINIPLKFHWGPQRAFGYMSYIYCYLPYQKLKLSTY